MSPLRAILALACGLGLAACTASDTGSNAGGPTGSGLSLDFSARRPLERPEGRAQSDAVVPVDRSVGATRHFGAPEPATTGAVSRETDDGRSGAGYKLNFEKAEIKDVVHAILNDTLGLNYTMSTDVAGQITISSARPLGRTELLSTLEMILAGQGFSMTNTGGSYRIAVSAAGAGAVDGDTRAQPGYGVSIVPLRHVSVAVMTKLVSGFVADTDGLRVDAARNAIVVRGPGAKRQEAVQAVLAFDADWMQNQSVSLFEVRRARPEAVVAELSQVFDAGENGAGSGVIQFKPITRLRAVLAVSKNPALIKRAETLIRRLDGESESTAENVFVYRARYRDAKELARIVTNMFGASGDARGQGGTQGTDRAGDNSPSPSGQTGDRRDSFGSSDSTRQASSGYGSASGLGGSSSLGGSGSSGANTFAAAFGNRSASGGSEAGSASAAPDVIDLTRQGPGAGARKIAVSADPANNAVITYTDGETYRKVHAALRQLDSTPLQVAVNVTIAEVQLNDQLRYGVQYFLGSDRVGLPKDKGSFSLFNAASTATSAATTQAANIIQQQIPGFNFLVGANASPDIIISALDSISHVEVLSSPSLVVLENQKASLQVGDEVPVTTRQAQSLDLPTAPIINQIEFRDTGIILHVTPRIGQNDAVTMQIEQEISSVSSAADTLTPTISKRKVASSISVVSGQTVLLAGLISQKRERGRSGIPGLGRLPGLGDLFSTTINGTDRTELVVFIRPVVIRNGEDARSVAEEFRSRLHTLGVQQAPIGPQQAPIYKR